LLARLSGPPTHQQVSLIASIAQLEWSALRNEAEALTLTGREARDAAREGREHRRLLANLSSDFERSLIPSSVKSAGDALSNIHARYGAPQR